MRKFTLPLSKEVDIKYDMKFGALSFHAYDGRTDLALTSDETHLLVALINANPEMFMKEVVDAKQHQPEI